MKLFTPEISWHQKEPIFSVDFCFNTWKLASCGADFTIKIWLVKEKDDTIGLDFLANLDRHCKPVNAVRFSPNGKLLASAGDDGAIILWKLQEADRAAAQSGLFGDDDVVNKESWVVHKMLRGHIEDVYDLAWSPDSSMLITGSVDNSAIVWDAAKGQNLKILSDHKHYVQGVCWDPRNDFVATHSSDRSCRVYKVKNYKCCQNIHKNNSSYKKGDEVIKSKLSKMFLDETMQSFFRRCSFSPDGTFLVLPAGICDGEKKPAKTTYMFERGQFHRPIKHFPGSKKATVCVRFSPVCYQLMDDKENMITNEFNKTKTKIPYRMVFGVASLDAITFYDTTHEFPIAHCANIHYASLTDLAWSSDGKLAVLSSTDGYCSFVKFEDGELGTPIDFDPIQYQITQSEILMLQQKDKRKSAKKESKKKDQKSTTDTDQEKNDPKKLTVSVGASASDDVEQKDQKSHNKLDRNQPTIDKLFSTPVRKRKRPSETSPNAIGNGKIKTTKEPSTPKSNSQSNPVSETLNSSSGSNLEKPAKRINVTTLESFPPEQTKNIINNPKSPFSPKAKFFAAPTQKTNPASGSRETKDNTMKAPKRVSVTTLETFTKSDNSSDTLKIASVSTKQKPVQKSPVGTEPKENNCNTNNSKISKTPPISPSQTEKKPKRIQVTTLCTFDSSGNEIPSTKVSADSSTSPADVSTSTNTVTGKSNTTSNCLAKFSDDSKETCPKTKESIIID